MPYTNSGERTPLAAWSNHSGRKLKRFAEPATPLQYETRYERKQVFCEPSWAQIIALLGPDISETKLYRDKINELEAILEFANLERSMGA